MGLFSKNINIVGRPDPKNQKINKLLSTLIESRRIFYIEHLRKEGTHVKNDPVVYALYHYCDYSLFFGLAGTY